jgi:hypothetical protein
MNNVNNSEYYKQKYLKYKFKYLEQKKLIGGVDPCPNEFGVFDGHVMTIAPSLLKMLNKYNCFYHNIYAGPKNISLYKISKKELEDLNNIKLLKSRRFPLQYFTSFEIAEKKKFTKQTLESVGFNDNQIAELELEFLNRIDMTRNELIQIVKLSKKKFAIDKFGRPEILNLIEVFKFTIQELKEIGFSPLVLYALLKNDKNLLKKYFYLFHLVPFDIKIYLWNNIFPSQALREQLKIETVQPFNQELIKLISIKTLKEFLYSINSRIHEEAPRIIEEARQRGNFNVIKETEKNISSWDTKKFLSFYTEEEQRKIKGEIPLEPEDETVRLKYIGTASEFKEIGFTLDELRGEFTLDELTTAGFSV